jgi:hypothetical protein
MGYRLIITDINGTVIVHGPQANVPIKVQQAARRAIQSGLRVAMTGYLSNYLISSLSCNTAGWVGNTG